MRGGFDEDGCIVIWEDYPYGDRGSTADGRPIGRLTCLSHGFIVVMGVAKGDDVEAPDRCLIGLKEDEDETEPTHEDE